MVSYLINGSYGFLADVSWSLKQRQERPVLYGDSRVRHRRPTIKETLTKRSARWRALCHVSIWSSQSCSRNRTLLWTRQYGSINSHLPSSLCLPTDVKPSSVLNTLLWTHSLERRHCHLDDMLYVPLSTDSTEIRNQSKHKLYGLATINDGCLSNNKTTVRPNKVNKTT